MPILELGDLPVMRFSGTGKTPAGGLTRAEGRVRDRGQPGARARIHERVHADALAWFSNLDAIANPPNGTWFQPSPARYSRIPGSRTHELTKGGDAVFPTQAVFPTRPTRPRTNLAGKFPGEWKKYRDGIRPSNGS